MSIDRALLKLQRVLEQSKKLPLKEMGEIAVKSINENFPVGGRYSLPGSVEGGNSRWVKRKDNKPHPILWKTGKLKKSVKFTAHVRVVVIRSNLVYSAFQNYGFAEKNVPARPYMVIQKEDRRKMGGLIKRDIRQVKV